MGILTIGIVDYFHSYFEKKRKIIKAIKGVEQMRKNVDALLIINNERLCDVYSDSPLPIKEAFKRADNILLNATKSISELITVEGDINLDFRDVETPYAVVVVLSWLWDVQRGNIVWRMLS